MSTPQPRVEFCILFGFIIGILSAISWILYVKHLVDTAQVPQTAEHWIETARTQAYGLCYDGCYDCLDVGSIEEACRMTTKTNLSGVICDASKMWTWIDRYPIECLQAVGEIYKADALSRKKFWLSALYILTFLSAPLGLLAYSVADFAIYWLKRVNLPTLQNRRPRLLPGRRNSNSATPLLNAVTVSILVLALSTPGAAYACKDYYPAYNQLFANADDILYGVVHGWLSNCYDVSYSCGESCIPIGKGSGSTSCSAIECTKTHTDKAPRDFVRAAVQSVVECGFRLVDVVPGVVDRRIANPRIEGKLWVKVAVNKFNGSEVVEEQVRCLYDMVEAPKW